MLLRCRVVLLAGGCLTYAAAVTAQPLTFARDDYASATGARTIGTADFNRDGWPDLAQANTGRNTVTILLNQSGARMTRAADIAVGAGPFDLAVGDYNRDGIPDLAVANADGNSISTLLGKGDGTFTRSDIATPSQNPRGITSADVDNDGKPDLIYTGYATGTVQLLIGNGSGGFTKGLTYTSSAVHPQGLATGDFNHDGNLDVAVAYASGTGLRILYGNGGTAFTARTVTGDTYLNVLAVGDFNRDGWLDVAAASTSGSSVGLYRGSATGFSHTATYVVGSSPRGIAVADPNDDGMLDLITANRGSSTVSILRGDRAHPGAFLSHVDVAAGTGSRAVVAGDFDADGRLDIATGNEYASTTTVLSNVTAFDRAAYVFSRTVLATGDYYDPYSNVAWPADFNRDGRLDVAVSRLTQEDEPLELSVLLTGGPVVQLPRTGYPQSFGVADLNADGNPDVVYLSNDGYIHADMGNGRGGFAPATPTPNALWLGSFKGITIGDLDRDARPDLVLIGYGPSIDGVLQVMTGNGDGTFRAGQQIPLEVGQLDAMPIVTDMNRDGKPDVVVLFKNEGFTQNDTVRIWTGNGAGELSPESIAVPFGVMSAEDVKVGDLNRDGYPDIVVTGDVGLSIALGGAAGFGQPVHLSPDALCGAIPVGWGACWAGPQPNALADINVDGALDVVRGGDLLPGNGTGTFRPDEPFVLSASSVHVVDFTRDGLPDIVYAGDNGEIGVLVNQRNAVNRPPAVTAGPDVTIPYERQVFNQSDPVSAIGSDPDLHTISFVWRDASGAVVSNYRTFTVQNKLPGSYRYTVTASDGRGGVVTDSVVVTIAPTKEIVVHMCEDVVDYTGKWERVLDTTAASGCRAHDPNLGAPKVTTPYASPSGHVSAAFIVDPTQTYKLWLRLKADGNYWGNDSVWVQFSGSTTTAGAPAYRVGTMSGLSVNLEECSGCGISGWGWEDDGWGAVNRNGVLLRFPEGGVQYFVIQTREDGASVDQLVLSAEKYLTTRPGAAKNDSTILPHSYNPF